MAQPLYGLSQEQWNKAVQDYTTEIRKSPEIKKIEKAADRSKATIERRKAFFQVPTPENKEWLISHKFLNDDDNNSTNSSRSRKSNRSTQSNKQNKQNASTNATPKFPEKILLNLDEGETAQLSNSIQSIESQIQDLTKLLNALLNQDITYDSYEGKFLPIYVSGGLSEDEAKQEIRKDWDNLTKEERVKVCNTMI